MYFSGPWKTLALETFQVIVENIYE